MPGNDPKDLLPTSPVYQQIKHRLTRLQRVIKLRIDLAVNQDLLIAEKGFDVISILMRQLGDQKRHQFGGFRNGKLGFGTLAALTAGLLGCVHRAKVRLMTRCF